MKNKKLVIQFLKATVGFKLKQFTIIEQKDRLIIYSNNSNNGTFHETDLGSSINHISSSYMAYNEDKQRVEWNIF